MTKHGLDLLNQLACVLESGLLTYTGELKFSLADLCEKVAQAKSKDVPQRETVLVELNVARDLYYSRDYERAASQLSRASRIWWTGVVS